MAVSYLEAQVMSFPEAAEHFNDMKSLFQEKLYYQLSLKLQECLKVPFFQANDTLVRLYENFVKHFEKHIDPVELVIFVVRASKQCNGTDASLKFLDSVKDLVKEDDAVSKEAWLLLELERAQYELDAKSPEKLTAAKEKIDKASELMDTLAGLKDIVHSALYRLKLQYHKVVGTAADYFENAKMFLSYTPIEQISEADRVTLAKDIATAALIGEVYSFGELYIIEQISEADRVTLAKDIATAALIGEVYSFGELLQHDILAYLEKTEDQWLRTLLSAFNDGNIQEFEEILSNNTDKKVFAANRAKLDRKIRYMKMLDLVFKRDIHDRNLTFDEIRKQCIVRTNGDVEFLLMECMCLNLIKGVIDQVNETVEISWLQPRMLNESQLKALQGRLKTWSSELTEVAQFLEMPSDGSTLAAAA